MAARGRRIAMLAAVAVVGGLSFVFASFAADPDPRVTHAAAPVAAAGDLVGSEALFRHASLAAEVLATQPYVPLNRTLPRPFDKLDYDAYRLLRPRAEASIWRDQPGSFAVLPLPRGMLYAEPVELTLVEDGVDRTLRDPQNFVDFNDFPTASPEARKQLGISGWRALYPFNGEEKADEAVVFQGGAYFRALAKGLVYGASARAMTIGTASRRGEEFPHFRQFWIEQPKDGENVLNAVALLDTPSATGAYLFAIKPGKETVMDIRSVIFPRKMIDELGIGGMSSMFLHNSADRAKVDDYRPEVHDSDGLAMLNGNGEWIWRPLTNPRDLQVSAFGMQSPKGFGLLQRERDFPAYEDLEAGYEKRPDVWVEPVGDWGRGAVHLVEIPTTTEYSDNIAAFWRPEAAWQPGESHRMDYRLHWSAGSKAETPTLPYVSRTMVGANPDKPHRRRFVIDYAPTEQPVVKAVAVKAVATKSGKAARDAAAQAETPVADAAPVMPEVWASAGEIIDAHMVDNPASAGRRLVFDLDPKGAGVVELRAVLAADGAPKSETWLFRWTPE